MGTDFEFINDVRNSGAIFGVIQGGSKMVQVAFYDRAEDSVYKFAVIGAKKDGKWVL